MRWWAVQCGFELATDTGLILKCLPDTVRDWKEIRLQWEPRAAALERLPGELYLSLHNPIQFLQLAHNLKQSLDSDAAVRTVWLQNPAAGSLAELKTSKQAVVSSTGQQNITTWRGKKKPHAMDCLIFGKRAVDRNDHLKHCKLRGIDNLSVACCRALWKANEVINFQLVTVTQLQVSLQKQQY